MSIYQFKVTTIDGDEKAMESYRGKILLIVNVASQCGFTPQYAGLEKLFRDYRDDDFVVLGFPCNQFGAQEPGNREEIKQFCSLTYDVSFPLFTKIDVKGVNAHPMYQYLTKAKKGLFGSSQIKWNFTKFLIDRNGRVVKRFGPITKPEKLAGMVKRLVDSR